MHTVKLPQLSEEMEEGTITKWLKSVGDQVTEGEVLFEVETDKASNEVEAEVSGTLTKILVEEGETVEVDTPIAEIE